LLFCKSSPVWFAAHQRVTAKIRNRSRTRGCSAADESAELEGDCSKTFGAENDWFKRHACRRESVGTAQGRRIRNRKNRGRRHHLGAAAEREMVLSGSVAGQAPQKNNRREFAGFDVRYEPAISV